MKFILQLLLIALFTFLLQLILPWWIIFIGTGLGGLLVNGKAFASFLAGFLGVGLLWFVQAYLIDQANDSVLSMKVAGLFSLSSSMQIILATAIVGAICGGFGALTGHFLGRVFRKPERGGYY